MDVEGLLDRPETVLTLADVCGLLRVNRVTIWRRIKARRFPAGRRIGHALVWTAEDVAPFAGRA